MSLRLWSARAVDPMRLDAFNQGEHVAALSEQARAEAISKILYPSDETPAGQELRLRQEYFFVSASLQDLVHRHLCADGDIHFLPNFAAVQLNDTHPSIAVPELMRLLIDLHGLPWDEAWRICVETLSYTNHTLLPEALESWSLPLLGRMLPRHLEIIYRINEQHLRFAREKSPDADDMLAAAVSLIDERDSRRVRMGHLAFVGSHRSQWRVGAAHRADATDRFSSAPRALSRPHRQQDERHHFSPLAHAGQSRLDQALVRSLRGRRAGRSDHARPARRPRA